ncbi:MAG: fibronectin type III domain-containing protein, partial [Jatrophihabitantaceae bacterium]
MAGRRQHAAFRPAATPVSTSAPNRRQATAMITALILIAAAIAVASFTVRPSKARAFDLFYGSVFVNDNTAPVAIDLASGKPTVRLPDAYQQVNAKQPNDVDVVPLSGGTLLLDTLTGEFNLVDSTGIVAKSGGGVPLGKSAETTTSYALASGSSAYIVRTGASGTTAYLVGLSTVTSAIGGGPIRPRASVGMDNSLKNVATTTVTANGDLWMLAGAGSSRTIRQLSLPRGSNPGATLNTADHGSVNGVAAIGASTANADGSGGDAVAVASAGSIQVFDAVGGSHTLTVNGLSGADSIVPVTNQQGGFTFLYHAPAGWSIVRAAADGTGEAAVHPLDGIGASASLAVPAQSNGSVYTADLASGALWRIGSTGVAAAVPDVGRYPLITGETADFSLIKVTARGARVIYNSRTKLEAVTVFTDGSHKPIVNKKDSAADLTASGAAAALADLHNNPGKNKPTTPPKSHANPAQEVTDRINCQTVTQIPHIPAVDLVDRGSRSVQLHWTYPILDRQDCYPSTYTVTVKLLSGNAPTAPTLPPIQGSDGVNITGLFPDTQYSFVVTAYINGKGTPSASILVRTSVEGPAAPTNVSAVADDLGNWTLSWNSCGGVQNSCVPAANWTIVPQLCDGAGGLISAPANAHVVGDPTSHTFSMLYKGNPELLGRGLDFQVAGVGLKGTTGTTSKPSACTYSWAHPVPENIQVAASTPPGGVAVGGSTAAKVTVTFTGDQNVDLGGVGGQLTYRL